MLRRLVIFLLVPLLFSCHSARRAAVTQLAGAGLPSRKTVVSFAKKQLGTTYKYAGNTPREGFNCSGFICYVYGHFGMKLPRTSAAQSSYGQRIPLRRAMPGDLIFFAGKDPRSGRVGHAGIILRAAGDQSEFIHAAPNGVVITSLSQDFYKKRFVKVRVVLGK